VDGVVLVALLVVRRTNYRKAVGSMPANVVCITAIIIIIIIKRKLKTQINRKNVTNVPRWRSYQKL